MKIYEKIKKQRLKYNLTIKKLSKLSGVSVGTISEFEQGKKDIKLETLWMIAKVMGLKIEFYFDEEKINS